MHPRLLQRPVTGRQISASFRFCHVEHLDPHRASHVSSITCLIFPLDPGTYFLNRFRMAYQPNTLYKSNTISFLRFSLFCFIHDQMSDSSLHIDDLPKDIREIYHALFDTLHSLPMRSVHCLRPIRPVSEIRSVSKIKMQTAHSSLM